MDPRIASEQWGEGRGVYWIDLVPGYVFKHSKLHCVAGFSPEEAHARLEKIVPCACASCRILARGIGE